MYANADSNLHKWSFKSKDPLYNPIVGSCLNCFGTWSSTNCLENDILNGITSSKSTSSMILSSLIWAEYVISKFLAHFLHVFFSLTNFLRLPLHLKAYFENHVSFFADPWSISSYLQAFFFYLLSISISLTNCALVNDIFSSILG